MASSSLQTYHPQLPLAYTAFVLIYSLIPIHVSKNSELSTFQISSDSFRNQCFLELRQARPRRTLAVCTRRRWRPSHAGRLPEAGTAAGIRVRAPHRAAGTGRLGSGPTPPPRIPPVPLPPGRAGPGRVHTGESSASLARALRVLAASPLLWAQPPPSRARASPLRTGAA